MKYYKTGEGDTVDLIAYKHYGHHNGTAELIYKANEFLLLDQEFILDYGILLALPDLTPASLTNPISPLWE